jgi:hypothetical protein
VRGRSKQARRWNALSATRCVYMRLRRQIYLRLRRLNCHRLEDKPIHLCSPWPGISDPSYSLSVIISGIRAEAAEWAEASLSAETSASASVWGWMSALP